MRACKTRAGGGGSGARFVEEITIDTCTVLQRVALVCPFDAVLCFAPGVFDSPGGEGQSGE